jgi:hypothetical protein
MSVAHRGLVSEGEGTGDETNEQREGRGDEQWMHSYGLVGVAGAVWAISSLSSSETTGVGKGRRRGGEVVAASMATFDLIQVEQVVTSLLPTCQQ